MDLAKNLTKIIDNTISSKTESEQLKLELVKELNQSTLKNKELDVGLKTKLFERLPIPMILYTFLGLIIFNSIVIPVLSSFGVVIQSLPIDENLYELVSWITGFVFTKKTVDNVGLNLTKPKG